MLDYGQFACCRDFDGTKSGSYILTYLMSASTQAIAQDGLNDEQQPVMANFVAHLAGGDSAPIRREAISLDLRQRFIAFAFSNPDVSLSSAARTFGLAKSTAHTIMRRHETTGSTSIGRRGGATHFKITATATEALTRWLEESPDATLQALCDRLSTDLSITVSKQSVSKVLTKLGITIKLLRAIPASRNCPETLQARLEYGHKFLNDAPADRKNIIWVDECGFNLHIRRKYGRSRRGEHATITVPNGRGRNISACAAMSEEGFLYEVLRPGAYNAEAFCVFLEGLFALLTRMGRSNCWIVLDNVRFHHCTIVALCAQQHSHTLVFLPPYSPMLNPIESLFSKWKTLIRSQGVALTANSLLSSMANARFEIAVADCLGWIRDANRNIGLSLQRHGSSYSIPPPPVNEPRNDTTTILL